MGKSLDAHEDAPPLDEKLQLHLGDKLKLLFAETTQTPIPDRFAALLDQLQQVGVAGVRAAAPPLPASPPEDEAAPRLAPHPAPHHASHHAPNAGASAASMSANPLTSNQLASSQIASNLLASSPAHSGPAPASANSGGQGAASEASS